MPIVDMVHLRHEDIQKGISHYDYCDINPCMDVRIDYYLRDNYPVHEGWYEVLQIADDNLLILSHQTSVVLEPDDARIGACIRDAMQRKARRIKYVDRVFIKYVQTASVPCTLPMQELVTVSTITEPMMKAVKEQASARGETYMTFGEACHAVGQAYFPKDQGWIQVYGCYDGSLNKNPSPHLFDAIGNQYPIRREGEYVAKLNEIIRLRKQGDTVFAQLTPAMRTTQPLRWPESFDQLPLFGVPVHPKVDPLFGDVFQHLIAVSERSGVLPLYSCQGHPVDGIITGGYATFTCTVEGKKRLDQWYLRFLEELGAHASNFTDPHDALDVNYLTLFPLEQHVLAPEAINRMVLGQTVRLGMFPEESADTQKEVIDIFIGTLEQVFGLPHSEKK